MTTTMTTTSTVPTRPDGLAAQLAYLTRVLRIPTVSAC